MNTEHNSKIDAKDIKEALWNIKSNHDILITKADKGSNVVIQSKSDYLVKMSTIIDDSFKFKCLGPVKDYDKAVKLEKQICMVLKHISSYY